jgi:hypothetical protein
MGKDIKEGVVDGRLRVYGVHNLRVIDASIIPVIPDCRIQNSVYGIGEKVFGSTVSAPLPGLIDNGTGRRHDQSRLPGTVRLIRCELLTANVDGRDYRQRLHEFNVCLVGSLAFNCWLYHFFSHL